MNSKSHFIISLIKSLLRILSVILVSTVFNNINLILLIALYSFIIAEVLGILEEILDKR